MKQSQWTFEVHNCLCFSQRLRRFNKLLQQPNGYKSATQRKTLTGLQNKTKHPTTENKRITEIVGSHEIILLWSVKNMVCYESGLS